MLPKSSILKGKRFEEFVAREIESSGLGKARREHGSGNGLRKGDISWEISKTPEVKNHKSVPKKILEWIDQSKRQALGAQEWVLIVRDPRTAETNPDVFVVLDFWEWIRMEKKIKDPIEIEKPSNEMKWALKNVKDSVNRLIKFFE